MIDFGLLIQTIPEMLSFKLLLLFLIGSIAGMVIGALPGLTTTMGISLLISFTWGLDWVEAIILIVSLHVSGTYGGSTAAIFLNIPGTPAAAATALDGYPMSKRGEGGLARGLATFQSFLGTIFAAILFLIAAPLLTAFSMKFGSWEFFLLGLFGIIISANLASASLIKGLISGLLGLGLATIGMDTIVGVQRFTLGEPALMDGLSLIAVLIGLFGITEVIEALMELKPPFKSKEFKSVLPSWRMIKKYLPLGGKSSLIGSIIGLVPGAGADVAAWVSYDAAKRSSKSPETFGKGNPEGVVAAETANNACVPGSYVPMLTLGIPGDSVTAVIIGGLLLHGLQPGPLLIVNEPNIIYQFFIILIIASIFLLIFGLLFSSLFQKVLLFPKSIVLTVVTVFSVIGTYAVSGRTFDIAVMFAFGILGFLMKRIGISAPPLVLGLILGAMAETNFRRAMVSADYSFLPFITRPISLILVLLIVFVLAACGQSNAGDKDEGSSKGEENYPNKSIEILVGFGEGGGTDTMARALQSAFQESLGESVQVNNMPGASSALALEEVNKKPADGHTILFQTDLVRVFPAMGMTDLTYNDFEQIGIGTMGIANFVVGEDSELENFEELVELVKSGEAKVAVAGIGDPWHVTLEILKEAVGGETEIITYESGSNAAMAALKGEVDFAISGVNEVADLIRSGDARSLAVMDNKAFDVKGFGEIPPVTDTIAELEPFVPEGTWWGPAVKKGTPEHIVQQLKEVYEDAIQTEEFIEFAENNAIVLIDIEDPQDYARKDTEKTSWMLYEVGAGERSPEEVGISKPN